MSDNKDKVDKKIRNKVRFFMVMFIISLTLAINAIFTEMVPARFPLIAFFIGLGAGLILSRIQKITWDKDGERIVKEFDLVSGILVFFLILLLIFKEKIVHQFVNFPKINSIIFSLNAGIMLGRTILIRHKVIKILRNNA
ncbi:hypothetical protein [Namhaeicola litoreus]|uniref:Uncharacterized protein n=1 Tax=Namhaeicola litoreus TaxID=1052145 RepID=A0ABW3XXB0_9FLAO